jgi:hypothetical protein
MRHAVTINRAPVLTLWTAVVAQRLGFERNEALTFGRAVAGLNAYSLYEKFRPRIPAGQKGWGAAGKLSLDAIRSLAGKYS